MISDFLAISKQNSSIYEPVYSCELPDITSTEDTMITCGSIIINESSSGLCFVRICLIANFLDLCIGDTYQQKAFVQAALYIIEMQSDYDFSDAQIEVRDCWGVTKGKLEDLNTSYI